jgi:hypothetical protein
MENYIKRFKQYFYHQTVTTKQIEDYLSSAVGIDLELFFHQYLRDTRVPTLEYYFKDSSLSFRWINCVKGFDMPVKIFLNGEEKWIKPTTLSSVLSTLKIRNLELMLIFM